MITHRPSGAYLILLALALAGWCLHDPLRLLALPPLLGAIALAYRFPQWLLRPTPWQIALGAGLGLAFGYFVCFAGTTAMQLSIYSFRLVEAGGLTLLVLIGLQWFSWRSALFDWLLFSLGSLLMLGGVSWQTLQRKPVYLALVLGFIGTLLILRLFPRLQPHRAGAEPISAKRLRGYYLRMLPTLLLTLGVGWACIQAVEEADRRFNDFLTQLMMHQNNDWSGFSGHTVLQGEKQIQLSERVAFRVESARAPAYWRGNILTAYRDGHWFPEEALEVPLPSVDLQPAPAPTEQQRFRLLPERATGSLTPAEVHMQDHYNGIVFAPGEATTLILPPEARAYRNQYGLFRRELRQVKHRYSLALGPDLPIPALWDEQMLRENLALLPSLRRELEPLARRITAGAVTPQEKALRLQNWFQSEFSYSLSMGKLTPGVDPTLDFIQQRRPAWCSWFASGMVLMLRSLDIPAHVVSGWRSADWNPIAGAWLVKEKEAHDWVEMLDRQGGTWMRFDPTPPGQLAALTGSGQSEPLWQQIWEGLLLQSEQWREDLSALSWQQRLERLQAGAVGMLRQPAFYGLLLGLLVLNALLKRRHRQLLPPPQSGLHYAGPDARLQHQTQRLQHWLLQRQLQYAGEDSRLWLAAQTQLSPSETQALSDILSLWEACRYGPDPLAALPELEKALDRLCDASQAAHPTI